MIKTGIESVGYFTFGDEKEGLEKAKAHGYDCLDYGGICADSSPLFTYSEENYEKYLVDLGNTAKRIGIEFFQAHGLWPKDDTTEELRERSITYYEKQIRGCAFLGCERLVIHTCMPDGWAPEKDEKVTFEENVKVLERLLPTAEKYGVKICVENLPFWHLSMARTEAVKKLVRAVDSKYAKICLDTGHANVMKENIYESVKTAGSDLEVLHVHDNTGSREDRHYIPYQGNIDWEGFVKGLNEIGYRGCMSLETVIAPRMPEPMREEMRIALAKIARHLASKVGGAM
ncbi:MAG: sugar phosphate isomerase/epimerase [Clostridia bacterium]|nr:sugar phosphate isomerase/epimerase [Clostridia bacterium]